MKLPNGLTAQQIRVLQEFRRKTQDELTPDEIAAICHPGGDGGDEPARALATAGYVESIEGGYRLTDRGKEFLARPSAPLYGGEAAGSGE